MGDNLHRLKKVCRYASKVLTVGYVVLFVLAVATLITGIASFFSDDVYKFILDFTRAADGEKITVIAAFVEATVIFLVGSITVERTNKIVKSIEGEHSPFTQKNADIMMFMCYMYIVTAVVILVLEYLARKSISLSIFAFLALLFVAVVIYALKLVFQYGAILQKESDETL